LLYRRWRQLLAPVGGARRLGIDGYNLMPRSDQGIKAWNRKFRCSHKGKAHRDFSFV
jgi:hypothetical protein